MAYFNTNKIFLTLSYTIDEKENEKINKFLILLEESGVGEIISRYVKNDSKKGGRPNCNYYRLFATILYGFAFDKATLREIEDNIAYDLRYISIMENAKVDYTTISKFINKVILENEREIFSKINLTIKKYLNIDFEDAFIDGSKFEANANKYKFIWKPTTYHKRISVKANEIIKDNNLIDNYKPEELIKSGTIGDAITKLSTLKDSIEPKKYKGLNSALSSILTKVLEYENKEMICGPNRNSFYKTDIDATAMALKADYYAGLGTHMHAAYNTQILVIKGLIFAYYVSQSRTDYDDFVPVLNSFYENYNCYPKNVSADAGYGIKINYVFLKEHNIENYVKYQSWEGNVSGKNPDCYKVNDDNTINCLNGLIGEITEIPNRHPKKKDSVFFKVNGCLQCGFSSYCKRFMKNQEEDFKIFEVDIEFQKHKQQATENLLSVKGIEIRVNRSIQVEGAFGIIKQNYGRERFRRRSLKKVSCEFMLNALGFNIAKLFRFFETGKQIKYWIAPNDLEPQVMAKPSKKKLSKKGKKINQNVNKNKN